jgi:hypothetical protein
MLGLFGPKRDKSGPTERLLSTRGPGQEGVFTASRVVNEVVVEGALQHQLALGRLDELDFGCSRPVRSVSLWPFRVSIRSAKKCPAGLST